MHLSDTFKAWLKDLENRVAFLEKKPTAQIKMSKLEKTWAHFFDLAGWQWIHKPVTNERWQPTFYLRFDCGHSECGDNHELYVLVSHQEERCCPDIFHDLGLIESDRLFGEPCLAVFGKKPSATCWYMSHGAGGGIYSVVEWQGQYDSEELWKKAVEMTDKEYSVPKKASCAA
jgi:hypothetical protein